MRGIIAGFSLILLAACTSLPKPDTGGGVFSLQGRIAVKYGEETLSGLLQWQAEANADSLLLSSPIGQGLASIRRNAEGVTLIRPGEPDMQAESVESLTESALGFRIPLQGLRHWILGQPAPEPESRVVRNGSGEISEIEQDGWKVEYQDFVDNRARKLKISRPGMMLKLVVDEWKI